MFAVASSVIIKVIGMNLDLYKHFVALDLHWQEEYFSSICILKEAMTAD